MYPALDRLGTLLVRDVMTRHVVCLAQDQTLAEVAEVFTNKDISSAPVVDHNGTLVGVLSSVDFLKHRAEEDAAERGASGARQPAEKRVRDCMTRHVASIGADELLLRAAQIMCARHVHRLPVVGEDHRIEGLVSTMDIVSAMVNAIDEAEASHFGIKDF
ncbi:MAG: HPP family protein [Pirellulaceae bacterium]